MNIFSMTIEELENFFILHNDKKFRAVQVYDFLYKKRVTNIDDINNIGVSSKELLRDNFSFDMIKLVTQSGDKDAIKFLFELSDGKRIESVLMYHDYGISLCVSSQVGCNMGCVFCESGRLKKERDLYAHEMVEQILVIEGIIKKRISHVVIMGIGEPFDNYDEVIKFIKIVNSNKGIDIGSRHITLSTCGIIPGIERFMNEDFQVNLAISLHAPNDELRGKLMPINKAYPIKDLMDAIRKYIDKTHRRVTFEYILLESVNDSSKEARELAYLLKGMNAYVNLIPYNETSNIAYKRTKNDKIMEFYDILKKSRINVTVRREFGSNASAACGQLRANYMLEE